MIQKFTLRGRNIFTLDTRSLAVFRIFFGIVLCFWLTDFVSQIDRIYGTQAIVPPSTLNQYFFWENLWGFHTLFVSKYRLRSLFAVHYILIIFFIFGLYTKTTTFFLWIWSYSLICMNPILINSFDRLTCILILWSLFLPLGYSYSWDCFKETGKFSRPSAGVFSLASIGIILQLFFLYTQAAFQRWDHAGIHQIDRLWYVLNSSTYILPFGVYISQFFKTINILNILFMLLEGFGWLLFLIPYKQFLFRNITVILFIIFHIGILFTMDLTILSFQMMAVWMMFRLYKKDYGQYMYEPIHYHSFCIQIFIITLTIFFNAQIMMAKYTPDIPLLFRYGNLFGLQQSRGVFNGSIGNYITRHEILMQSTSGSTSIIPHHKSLDDQSYTVYNFNSERHRTLFNGVNYFPWLSDYILSYYCRNFPGTGATIILLQKSQKIIFHHIEKGEMSSRELHRKSCF